MSAPSLDAASVALRMALDNAARAHHTAGGACAERANALALLSGVTTPDEAARRMVALKAAEQTYRTAEALSLGARELVADTERVYLAALAHAVAAGEVAP